VSGDEVALQPRQGRDSIAQGVQPWVAWNRQLVEEMKVDSSSWAKKQAQSLRHFQRQSGYAAFSVSQSSAPRVKTYIANQEQHHRKITFQDEFRLLLTRHEIEFDERLVWD
jgi:hypothetical protein